MMFRINCIKGNNFSEKILNLDFSNTYHILWIYKNIREIYRLGHLKKVLEELKHVSIKDFTCGLSVYDDISQIVIRAYNNIEEGDEIDFFTTRKQDNDTYLFVKDNDSFFFLCNPIMDTCLKQVVDIFTYIYKIENDFTNINRLIEKNKSRKDILIELLLLKMRLNFYKKNESEQKDMEYINVEQNNIEERNVKQGNIKEKQKDLNFDNDLDRKLSDMIEKIHINKKHDICNIEYSNLEVLKDSLLEYEATNLNFFIENICIYLTYKDDDLLRGKLINYSKSGYKHLILKNITKEVYYKLMDHIEINEELIKMGIYDYLYFLKWSKTCFTNLSVLKINDFVEISKILIIYYRKEKDKQDLRDILNNLLKLNINLVSEQIKINILNHIEEYIYLNSNIVEDNLKFLLIESSESKNLRLILVKKLKLLKYFNKEEKNKILRNLFSNFDLNWRYRKVLIEECIKNKEVLGFSDLEWLNKFEKDKVYFIRQMVSKIKHAELSIISDKVKDIKELIPQKKSKKNEEVIFENASEVFIQDNFNYESKILESKPLKHIINEEPEKLCILEQKEKIFEKLKNNVKNKVKSIEEKIVCVSDKKNNNK